MQRVVFLRHIMAFGLTSSLEDMTAGLKKL
jgi:hypothetical protein